MPETEVQNERETPTAPELSTLIGPDGEFLEGWKEHLVPEDMRSEPVYNKFLDLKGALKQIGIQDRLVGRKGVLIPNEKSTATEWENFYEATGRPKTKDDYKLPVPDDIKEHYDPNLIAMGKDLFHKAGFNQKQAEALWQFEEGRIRQSLKAVKEAEETEKQETEDVLKRKWGEAYVERIESAVQTIKENAPPELEQKVLENYGNDPVIAELLYNMSLKFKEHPAISRPGQAGGAMTPGEAESKMKELQATPGYLTGELKHENPAAYSRILKDVASLAAIAAKVTETR